MDGANTLATTVAEIYSLPARDFHDIIAGLSNGT